MNVKVKFNCRGKVADLGRSGMPQYEHAKGTVLEVSLQCGASVVGSGLAEYYTEEKPVIETKDVPAAAKSRSKKK